MEIFHIPGHYPKIKTKDKCKCKFNQKKCCGHHIEIYKIKCLQNKNWFHRSYDGRNNNIKQYLWGCAGQNLYRLSSPDYEDGKNSMAVRGSSNPNPRVISNAICQSDVYYKNSNNLTDCFWLWGQFLDHELDISHPGSENDDIITPPDDPVLPNATISFSRSKYNPNTGINIPNSSPPNSSQYRQQINAISSFIDGTNVYGTYGDRVAALRKFDGSGQLITTNINGYELLPLNEKNLENAFPPSADPTKFFLAGDIRSNENILLTCIHTLFVLEHNRLVKEILEKYPEWKNNDEKLFSEARKMVIAFMQKITFDDFIPLLLGSTTLLPYTGYNFRVHPDISNEFSSCAYRLGHSMVSETLFSDDGNGNVTDVNLVTAFFNPEYLKQEGIENLLRGSTLQIMQEVDNVIVEGLRSNLFGPPSGNMMLDLAALNIQRGRDHGLPDYNTLRLAYGLSKVTSFSEITSKLDLQNKLESVYDDVNSIDPWIGGICEDHIPNTQVGPLFYKILSDQFMRLRDGDRFYYKNDLTLSSKQKNIINSTTLSDIIMRNTNISDLQKDVFQI